MQPVQGHAVSPDGSASFDDNQRATGDVGQWRERLGWGDGGGDGNGVDDEGGQFSSLSFFLWENESVHQTGNYLLHKVRYSPSSL